MESLEFIELDIPFCSLTYGVAPCSARLVTDNDPVAAGFDGSTDYLTRDAGFTGAADSKAWTVSCWVYINSYGGGIAFLCGATTLAGATLRARASIAATGEFILIGSNAAGTTILSIQSSPLSLGRWHHVLASVDLTSTSKRFIYVDDVSDLAVVSTYTNDTIDFTIADWAVGATPAGAAKLTGRLGDLWSAPGTYLDLSVSANRRLFVTAAVNPVDLGVTGNLPTGSAPILFMSGDISAWFTNKGTGGGFTVHGSIAEEDFSTGEIKCFNSKSTCQSAVSFDPDDVTLRFSKPTDYLPRQIECIPSLSDVSFTPATVSLGENLGTRATLQATFIDHPHSDTGNGFDKYLTERTYDPYSQGTFWGKFRARQPFLRGQAIRWIAGLVGDDIADMETRHFIIDSFDGPTPDGKYRLIAKDILKLADGDRSQAPVLSNGFLSADITAIATTANLLPSGIGNSEYPASGYLCIGGNEVVSFTRAADVLTIVRAQLGSIANTHKAQDRVQSVLRYAGEDASDIIYELLVTYAGVDPAYITLADWQAETAAYLGNVYTANICEPTSVAALISELIVQAALALWDDTIAQQIRLRVLHGVVTDAATFTPENTLAGTLTLKEQPEKRLSRIQTYFGQIDPTKPLSNLDNYRSTSLVIDDEAEADYGSASIKTILSRWIPQAGRSIADRVGTVQLGRYRDPPRRVTFSTSRYAQTDVDLGGGYKIESFCVQDATGAQDQIPVQVTRVNPAADRFVAEAEEMLFSTPVVDLANRQIIIDANVDNVNLRTMHDSIYPAPVAGDVVTCTINSGVTVGSLSAALIAFIIDGWPVGVTLNLIVNGRIEGMGGGGGRGGFPVSGQHGVPGQTGSGAFYTRYPINITNAAGQIWSGGGGGGGGGGFWNNVNGGGGGGGGGGDDPGVGGNAGGGAFGGSPGSTTAGGAGGAPGGIGAAAGGAGGGPGIAGVAGSPSPYFGAGAGGLGGAAGAAGAAIDGSSFVTLISTGDIRGGQIN